MLSAVHVILITNVDARFKNRVDAMHEAQEGMKLTSREQEIFTELDHRLKRVLIVNPEESKYRIKLTVWAAKRVLREIEMIRRFVRTFDK